MKSWSQICEETKTLSISKQDLEKLKSQISSILKKIGNVSVSDYQHENKVHVTFTYEFHEIDINTDMTGKDAARLIEFINKLTPIIEVNCRLIQNREYQRGKFKDDGVTYKPGPRENEVSRKLNGAKANMSTDAHAIKLQFNSVEDAVRGIQNQFLVNSMRLVTTIDSSPLYWIALSQRSPHILPEEIDLSKVSDPYNYTYIEKKN